MFETCDHDEWILLLLKILSLNWRDKAMTFVIRRSDVDQGDEMAIGVIK